MQSMPTCLIYIRADIITIPVLKLSLLSINQKFAALAQFPHPGPSPEPQIYTVRQTVHHFWLLWTI